MQITHLLAQGMQEQRTALEQAVNVLKAHRASALSGYAREAIEDNISDLVEEIGLLTGTLARLDVEPPQLVAVNG